ncbi:MAG: GntR family transcriptional regulator [Phycisphaerae bacterium]
MPSGFAKRRMSSHSRATYKYQRVRERLRRDIQTGRLTGKLPGERRLARRYSVNPKTVNKALTDLAVEGLLIRQVGRGSFVAAQGSAGRPAPRPARFAWVCSRLIDQHGGGQLFEWARTLAADQGHSLDRTVVDLPLAAELSERTLRPSYLRGLDGVLVYATRPSRDFLAEVLRRHLPLVIAEAVTPQLKTNAVVSDYCRGAYELTVHLIQLGRQPALLGCVGGLLPIDQAVAGYRTAMQRHRLPARPPLLYEAQDPTAASLPDPLAQSLLDAPDRPTGLVAAGAHVALAVDRAARQRSLSIGQQLSLAVLAEPDQPLPDQQGWTDYQADVRQIIRWAVWLLLQASPGRPPQQVIVPGRITHRASTSPGQEPSPPSPTEAIV